MVGLVDYGQEASVPTEQTDKPAAPYHKRERGPVELLCQEIGFPWDRRLEREDVFVAFVRELVEAVAHRVDMAGRLSPFTGTAPSPETLRAVDLGRSMTALDLGLSRAARMSVASALHDLSHEVNPDDPRHGCNHDVDMLSLCASAIRFGLETPCRSRHAAAAAQHVWKHVYGVTLFDSQTPAWEKEWARGRLSAAIISLLPKAIDDGEVSPAGYGAKRNEPEAIRLATLVGDDRAEQEGGCVMDVEKLIDRLTKRERGNALDVLIEVAVFEPDADDLSCRANNAGTKVIYTARDGTEATHWAPDWSLKPVKAIDALRQAAQRAKEAGHGG